MALPQSWLWPPPIQPLSSSRANTRISCSESPIPTTKPSSRTNFVKYVRNQGSRRGILQPDGLISSALLGDGAAVFVVGSDPEEGVEKPILEICSTVQTILPDSDGALLAHIREHGLYYNYVKDVPALLCSNVEGIVSKLLAPFEEKPSYNDLFWAVHPGSADALAKLEKKLGLDVSKLGASKEVLASYGNLSSAALLFVINQLREDGFSNEYGVAIGYGPGITVESVLLRKV